MKFKLNLLTIALPVLFLTGCSSTSMVNSDAEKILNDKVETRITDSVQQIAKALQEIQNISYGRNGRTDTNTAIGNTVAARVVAKPQKINVSEKRIDAQSSEGKQLVLSKLDQKTNLKWNGDASGLLKTLSQKIGFSYKTEGVKTNIPVNINAKNQTVKEVLGLIDAQTSSKADIKISSVDRTIKFIYK